MSTFLCATLTAFIILVCTTAKHENEISKTWWNKLSRLERLPINFGKRNEKSAIQNCSTCLRSQVNRALAQHVSPDDIYFNAVICCNERDLTWIIDNLTDIVYQVSSELLACYNKTSFSDINVLEYQLLCYIVSSDGSHWINMQRSETSLQIFERLDMKYTVEKIKSFLNLLKRNQCVQIMKNLYSKLPVTFQQLQKGTCNKKRHHLEYPEKTLSFHCPCFSQSYHIANRNVPFRKKYNFLNEGITATCNLLLTNLECFDRMLKSCDSLWRILKKNAYKKMYFSSGHASPLLTEKGIGSSRMPYRIRKLRQIPYENRINNKRALYRMPVLYGKRVMKNEITATLPHIARDKKVPFNFQKSKILADVFPTLLNVGKFCDKNIF